MDLPSPTICMPVGLKSCVNPEESLNYHCSFSLSLLRHQTSSGWEDVYFHVMSLILLKVECFSALSSKASIYLLDLEHISDLRVLTGTYMSNNCGQDLGKQKLVGPHAHVGMACQRTME